MIMHDHACLITTVYNVANRMKLAVIFGTTSMPGEADQIKYNVFLCGVRRLIRFQQSTHLIYHYQHNENQTTDYN